MSYVTDIPYLSYSDFFYLPTLHVEGYCCIWLHSMVHTRWVGLLCMSNRRVVETSTWQHTSLTRDIHLCSSGIRTRNPIKRTVVQQPESAYFQHSAKKYLYFSDIVDICEQVTTKLKATLSFSLSLSLSLSVYFSVPCHSSNCVRQNLSYSYVRWATDFKSKQFMSSSDRVVVIITLG